MNSEKTGKFISELRKEKDLTQLQLAELLHVSDKAVSRWETGKGFPDIGSLESIADVLGVSVAELLRGERLKESLSKDDAQSYAADLLSLLKRAVNQKRMQAMIAGFLLGAIVLTVLIVHLNAPIYVKEAQNALKLENLSDGKIVAVMKEDIAGYEISDFIEPDENRTCRTISCYRTLLHSFLGKKAETIVVLGESDGLDLIYYYPGENGDQLLYAKNGSPDFGIETLPRLIYNYWIVLGAAATLIGFTLHYVLKKKYYAETLLKTALVPLSFTLSTILALIGRSDQVYNAVYYLSGILLLSVLIYGMLRYVLHFIRQKA
ncbi:MAG: helix-turn-helix transcriptional regulator [Erysipelotrichaceae bacterium]|nr:helix-turn-helix transcriptional regulator [Erysipelotrichaceae bacterium]